MRYIGNKTKLLNDINDFIVENDIQGDVFCDIFAGTGSVSDFFKDRFQIIANDFLSYSNILVRAKITNAKKPNFKSFIKKFNHDPFEYFNNKKYVLHENYFVTHNYSPLANRQFLSIDNAIKIDGIRIDLDNFYKWGILSESEFTFLLASLLESTTKFSNTSGTYEAFLKDWDPRSLKDFFLSPLEIQITCFHESRHAFQWKVITGVYNGAEVVDSIIVQKWKDEMNNYNQPTKKDILEEEYLKQEIEIDAITFAHKMMLEHFGVKTVIPECINGLI